jgi:hypothetical protein
MKTLSSFTARQPIQISGKGVTSVFFVTGDGYNFLYVIPADWDFAIVNHKTIPTMKVYLYPYIQAINLNLGEGVGKLKLFVIVPFSCCYHQQSRAYNFL